MSLEVTSDDDVVSTGGSVNLSYSPCGLRHNGMAVMADGLDTCSTTREYTFTTLITLSENVGPS